MAIYVKDLKDNLVCLRKGLCGSNGKSLRGWISLNQGIPLVDLVLYYNGRIVQEGDELQEDAVYHVSLRLRGGKGGFGSMLRRLGAQIEKTTNHEACRDLSGRRMRDVNNEKKLAEWISKQSEQDAEREERRRAKLERMKSGPRHTFVDPTYDKQKKEVLENLDDAVTAGLEASADVPSSSGVKRKDAEDSKTGEPKKAKLWIGIDGADSDEDSDADISDQETPEDGETINGKDTHYHDKDTSNEEERIQKDDQVTSQQVDADGDMDPRVEDRSPQKDVSPQEGNINPQEDMSSKDEKVSPHEGDISSNVITQEGNVSPQEGNMSPQEGNMSPQEGNMSPHEDISSNVIPQEKNVSPQEGNMSPQKTDINSERDKNSERDMNSKEVDIPQEGDVKPQYGGKKDSKGKVDNSVSSAEHTLLQMLKSPTCTEGTPVNEVQEKKELNLEEITSVKELETFGLELLKAELMNRGLKCGGTLEERARRLFAVKGLSPDDIDPSLKAKPKKKKK